MLDVNGLDVQAQQWLMVLEQQPTVKEVVAKVKAAAAKAAHKREKRPSSRLPGRGVLIEFCTENGGLGKAARSYDDVTVVRVTKETNAYDKNTIKQLHDVVKEFPGIAIYGSLPCAPWSVWQVMGLHTWETNSNANRTGKE